MLHRLCHSDDAERVDFGHIFVLSCSDKIIEEGGTNDSCVVHESVYSCNVRTK